MIQVIKVSLLEAVVQRCSVEKMFLEICVHRKTPVPESLFK